MGTDRTAGINLEFLVVLIIRDVLQPFIWLVNQQQRREIGRVFLSFGPN
jgi:hypothetical protein